MDDDVPADDDFGFLRFNPLRADRGVAAAQVMTPVGPLWMTLQNIRDNLVLCGPSAALSQAEAAYLAWIDKPTVTPRREAARRGDR